MHLLSSCSSSFLSVCAYRTRATPTDDTASSILHMLQNLTITEDWIKQRIRIEGSNLEDIRTLILQGNHDEKISFLGSSMLHFTRLKILDLSRNAIKSIHGIEHLLVLEVLNLYYNSIDDVEELRRLQCNKNLKDLDLRLNPISRLSTDYRLYLIHLIPTLMNIDCRAIRDAERKVALTVGLDNMSLSDWSDPYNQNSSVDNGIAVRLEAAKDIPNLKRTISPSMNKTCAQTALASQAEEKPRLNGYHVKKPAVISSFGNSASTWNQPALTRGLKHAEFYDRRERYLTEIEANNLEKVSHAGGQANHKSERIKAISFTSIVENTAFGDNTKHIPDEPKVAPRTRRTSSPGRKIPTSNRFVDSPDSVKKNDSSKSTEAGHYEQVNSLNQISTTGVGHNTDIDVEVERVDHSFFMIMKNLIQEAVSESFAKYNQNERCEKALVGNKLSSISQLTKPSKIVDLSDSSTMVEAERDITVRNPTAKPVPNDVICQSAFTIPKPLTDVRTKLCYKPTGEELLSPVLLRTENQRLQSEVERLKSQLKKYEQAEAEPHAWIVAEPTKVVSRIETTAICSTQNEITIPGRSVPIWRPVRRDGYRNRSTDTTGCVFSPIDTKSIRDMIK